MKKCLIILTVLLLLAVGAFAQAPNEISYQGKLTNADGAPIAEASSVTFAIYADSSGGTAIYTSTQTITPDENGIFTVNLAGVDGTDFNGSIRYLGIKVGTDAEMTPRQRINSAPYSYSTQDIPSNSVNSANIVDNSITGADILTGTITGSDVASGSIYDIDIGDEPGIAHTFQNVNATLLTTTTIIDSVMITVPTSGNIVYQAAGAVELHLSASGEVKTIISLSASRTSMDYDNMTNFDLGVQAANTYYAPVSIIVVDAVPAAGTYKYYLLGTKSLGVTTAIAYRCHILATFYPTSYGTVEESKSGINNSSSTPLSYDE